jgi:hypothetical protein
LRKQAFVGFLANKLPAGKEGRALPAVFEFVAKIGVRRLQAEAVRLGDNRSARDPAGSPAKSLRHTGGELPALRSVLCDLPLRQGWALLNLRLVMFWLATWRPRPARLPHQLGPVAGNQRNHHCTAERKVPLRMISLMGPGVGKSNHVLVTQNSGKEL